MKLINQIANFFNQRQILLYLLLFVTAFSIFGFLNLDPTFADPDSFYHAKITQILKTKGAISEFPWLTATNLRYSFIDHHFLYHLILIPFISFLGLPGLKLATVIFASLTIVVIFWFLKKLEVKGAFYYALFLLTVNPFVFRLNLAKAQQLVLAFIFIFIHLLFRRQYLALVLTSCLFVWLYGGWPLLLLLAFFYVILNFIWYLKKKDFFVGFSKSKNYRQLFFILISVGIGVLAGLFFSPYFPKNLSFYWNQSFKIAVVNYQYLIGVGGEWYPYELSSLIFQAAPFFALLIFSIFNFIFSARKQSINSWFFAFFSFFFFILTLKSRRYVEYFIPFSVIFCAISISLNLENIKKILLRFFPKKSIVFLPILLLLVLSPVFVGDLDLIKDSFASGYSFDKFKEASSYLKEHSVSGDIVFHSDWDEFPVLFYHNDRNYYLVGLDPTFMYQQDPDLYILWADITTGRSNENLYKVIKDIFNAQWVFVDVKQNETFARNLSNNFFFEKVFENEESAVYRVTQ